MQDPPDLPQPAAQASCDSAGVPERLAAPPTSQAGDAWDSAAVRMLVPVGRCGYAIAAGYLALFSVVPGVGMLTAIAAIVLAAVAHRRIRANPALHGMGRVIFAYVFGGIILAGYAVFLVVASIVAVSR